MVESCPSCAAACARRLVSPRGGCGLVSLLCTGRLAILWGREEDWRQNAVHLPISVTAGESLVLSRSLENLGPGPFGRAETTFPATFHEPSSISHQSKVTRQHSRKITLYNVFRLIRCSPSSRVRVSPLQATPPKLKTVLVQPDGYPSL